MTKIKYIITLFVISGWIVSCKVVKNYQQPQSELSNQNLYRETTNNDSISTGKVAWTEIFRDEKLQNIIRKVISNNLDLKIAIERINQADAVFKQSQLATLPVLSAYASPSVSKNSPAAQNVLATEAIPNFQLGISAGWEINIWGKISSAKRSAYANFLQTDAAKRAVQTQLVAQAADLYYQLLSLDKQLEITKQTIEIRKKDLESSKLLMDAAYLTGADIAQSEANLYSAQLSVPDLEVSIAQTENALSILMNEIPQNIDRNSIDSQEIYSNLRTSIPALLLKNRPDVQAAELAFRTAFENENIALASLYPSINISASLGLSSRYLSDFFTNSVFYSAAGTISQNIFQQGTVKTQIKTTESVKQQALYAFQQTVLTAGSEVSNALLSFQKAREKEDFRKSEISSLQTAWEFSKELLVYSNKANYINVLTAEQSLLQARLSAVNDKLQQLQAVTEFYRALGGGQF